jgi:hypothetical protein
MTVFSSPMLIRVHLPTFASVQKLYTLSISQAMRTKAGVRDIRMKTEPRPAGSAKSATRTSKWIGNLPAPCLVLREVIRSAGPERRAGANRGIAPFWSRLGYTFERTQNLERTHIYVEYRQSFASPDIQMRRTYYILRKTLLESVIVPWSSRSQNPVPESRPLWLNVILSATYALPLAIL